MEIEAKINEFIKFVDILRQTTNLNRSKVVYIYILFKKIN